MIAANLQTYHKPPVAPQTSFEHYVNQSSSQTKQMIKILGIDHDRSEKVEASPLVLTP